MQFSLLGLHLQMNNTCDSINFTDLIRLNVPALPCESQNTENV